MYNNHQTQHYFQQHLVPLVGVLRCVWHTCGKVSTITLGTAVLISPSIVLTCAHNIYSEAKSAICDKAQFIPNVKQGLLSKYSVYQISKQSSFKYKLGESFQEKPTAQELALLLLDKPIHNHQKLVFPVLTPIPQQTSRLEVRIVGYPNSCYYPSYHLTSIQAYRQDLQGTIHSIQPSQSIINHTVPTSVGFSGSPIFLNHQGSYAICGIHTHRGLKPQYNSGVYFTSEVLTTLLLFFDELQNKSGLIESLNIRQRQEIEQVNSNKEEIEQGNGKQKDECQSWKTSNQVISEVSSDAKYDNASRISCFDDLLERDQDFEDTSSTSEQE